MHVPLHITFKEIFGDAVPVIARAPGRINLIGEHTDYNEGFVLPAAINRYVYTAAAKRDDNLLRLYSVQYREQYEVRLDEIKPLDHHWANYVLGVVDQLLRLQYPIAGFDMVIDGDIPTGAGMSSSAAMECSVVESLNRLFALDLFSVSKVLIAQAAEHTYPGVKCGIMDPYASVFGQQGMAFKLDCRDLKHDYVPLDLDGYKIVLFNTNVKHSLASSAYNQRRAECEEGVALMQTHFRDVRSLRDATLSMLYASVDNALIKQRCRYVIKENARLLAGCDDLAHGRLAAFGQKMYETHYGLRDEYEVSCPELDFLVGAVHHLPGVLGARMMGGGFGGCTINIIRDECIDSVHTAVAEKYFTAFGKETSIYIAETANGATILEPHIVS